MCLEQRKHRGCGAIVLDTGPKEKMVYRVRCWDEERDAASKIRAAKDRQKKPINVT
jgi:hypothetical protein